MSDYDFDYRVFDADQPRKLTADLVLECWRALQPTCLVPWSLRLPHDLKRDMVDSASPDSYDPQVPMFFSPEGCSLHIGATRPRPMTHAVEIRTNRVNSSGRSATSCDQPR